MILRALVELARSEGLTQNLDYQPMPVRWLVTIDREGKLLGGVADLQQPNPSGKGKPVTPARPIPNRSKRTSGVSAEFVVDKAGYVFGRVREGDEENPKAVEKATERLCTYKKEVALAAERSGDEGLRALALFLDGVRPELPEAMTESDLVAFSLYEDDGGLLTDRPAVAAYWACRRREGAFGSGEAPAAQSATVGDLTCLATGEATVPVRLHPKIKGIPPQGDTKGGVQLTSVNQPSFESYGLDGFGCAPVSPQAADAYEKALNWLLANDLRNVRLSYNSVAVFWSKGAGDEVDLFSDAVSVGGPEEIGALYGSPWKGRQLRLAEKELSPFYCLVLSGAIGRGTVRGWNETTLGAVLRNLRLYFEDLQIVRRPDEEGKPRPLLALLRQLAAQGDLENVAPNLAAELFAAILAGRAFPRAVLDQLIRRVRADRTIYADRASFLKAYLCRARRAGDGTIPEVQPMLDENCKAAGYLLGRLFAVLEKAQDDAINANAGIRDRFYGAASATPVVVFPQLMRKLPHHLGKLAGGAVTFYEKLIQQISDGLQPPTPFPHFLTLEQQGLFAVGYYHQRQALFTKRPKETDDSTTKTETK